MRHFITICCLLLGSSLRLAAQAVWQETISPDIRSLQVVAGVDFMRAPIVTLGGDEVVNISFDYMGHDHRRYTYRIVHCEADWRESDALFESDYIAGFSDGLTIDDDAQSLGTSTLYTHYRLSVPNEQCRLTLSGNYSLTVLDEEGTPQVRARFMVVEPRMRLGVSVSGDTDIDTRRSHQQLTVTLAYGSVTVTDPSRQLTVVAFQNNRPSTVRRLPAATLTRGDGLTWQHCRDLIFPATNEYRKFECLDIHRSSLGVDCVTWADDTYHAWLNTDRPRPHYVYDEDANGAFYIRNTDNRGNDTQSEYLDCHFEYAAAAPFAGEVYVNGVWTADALSPQYRMAWDETSRCYRLSVPLKMGYYSYQYLLLTADGSVVYLPTEGNYWETENQYTALAYYRPTGGRTDLLYAVGEVRR